MSDFYENNETDDLFRRAFEGQQIEPPTSVWENVKNVALERQLIGYQSANLWLKGLSSVLTVMLGSVGYLYWQKTKEIAPITATPTQIVRTITKNDTIFVNRQMPVYVQVPAARQLVSDNEALTQNNDEILVEASERLTQKTDNEAIENKQNRLTNDNNTGDNENENLANKTTNGDAVTNKNRIAKNKTANNNTERLIKNQKSSTYVADNESNTTPTGSNTKIIDNTAEAAVSQSYNTNTAAATNFVLAPLTPLPFMPEYMAVASPEFEYKNRFKSNTRLRRGLNMDWLNGTSIIGYMSLNDKSNFFTLRDTQDAFSISEQEMKTSHTWGLRVETKISKKLAITVGYKHSKLALEQNNPKEDKSIELEIHKGSQQYLLKTPTGIASINTSEFTTGRKEDKLSINQKISQSVEIAQIPVNLRYAFWQKRWQMYSLAFYGLGGVNITIPYNQTANVIVKFNNKNYLRTLTSFDNIQNAWGVQAAVGTELGFGYHAKIFIEPSINQTVTSIVKDMPVRTLIGNRGVRFGAKWSFGK
jgi:hypothetical protein